MRHMGMTRRPRHMSRHMRHIAKDTPRPQYHFTGAGCFTIQDFRIKKVGRPRPLSFAVRSHLLHKWKAHG